MTHAISPKGQGNLNAQTPNALMLPAASAPSYQHLGGDCTPELQQKIDTWVASNKGLIQEYILKETKDKLINLLVTPNGELHLEEILLEPLYPVIFDPVFASRVHTLIIDRCSTSDTCNPLEPFLEKIHLFPKIKKLSLAENDLTQLPQDFFKAQNLTNLEIFESAICPSFNPLDVMARLKNLTAWTINSYTFSMDISSRQWLSRIAESEFFTGEVFKTSFIEYFRLANEDAVFRETLKQMIELPAIADEKMMLAFSILRVGQAFFLRLAQRQGVQQYVEYLAKTVFPLQLLQEVASQTRQEGMDSLELFFILIEKLRSAFNWDLDYFPVIPSFQNRQVAQEDLDKVEAYIMDHLNNEQSVHRFVCDSLLKLPQWREFLYSQFPTEYQQLLQQLGSIQDEQERCQVTENFSVQSTQVLVQTLFFGRERLSLPGPEQAKKRYLGSRSEG